MRSLLRPAPDPAAREPDRAPVRRLGRASLAWRSAALLIGVFLVVRGTLVGDDPDWPFGPMSQFAFRVGADDEIHSLFLEARTTTGEVIVVPINRNHLGIGRAEVEGQLTAIQQRPVLLSHLVDSYRRLHPGMPQLTQVWLRDKVTALKNGRAAGVETRPLVGWPVDER